VIDSIVGVEECPVIAGDRKKQSVTSLAAQNFADHLTIVRYNSEENLNKASELPSPVFAGARISLASGRVEIVTGDGSKLNLKMLPKETLHHHT
jgi:hypothetical protein